MKKILFFAVVFVSVFSCSGQDTQLKQQCEQKDSTNSPDFLFFGFTYAEVNSTLVKDLQNNLVVDSFYISSTGVYDSLRSEYDGILPSGFIHLKDTYQFYIPGYQPYTLSNIKTKFKGVYMGYLCLVGQYDLNGVTYYNANPEFNKASATKIGN